MHPGHQQQRRHPAKEGNPYDSAEQGAEYRPEPSSRVYVGNVSPDAAEADLKELFTKFGQITDFYLNGPKCFAFIKLAGKDDATKASDALDGMQFKGRALRVRKAFHNACLYVGDLSPVATNELLYDTFRQFGKVERAIVNADERGFSTTWGIVEFEKKHGALRALRACEEGMLLMTKSWKPVRAELAKQADGIVGIEAKHLNPTPKTDEELSVGCRFAARMEGRPEHAFAKRWLDLYALEREKKAALKEELKQAREALSNEMRSAMQEEDRRMNEERRRDMFEMRREAEMRQREMDMRYGGPPAFGHHPAEFDPYGPPVMGNGYGPPHDPRDPRDPRGPRGPREPPLDPRDPRHDPRHAHPRDLHPRYEPIEARGEVREMRKGGHHPPPHAQPHHAPPHAPHHAHPSHPAPKRAMEAAYGGYDDGPGYGFAKRGRY